MDALDPLLSPLEELNTTAPREHAAHLVGLVLRQLARSGESLGVSASLAEGALAGMRMVADGGILRRLHWVLRSWAPVLAGSAEAVAAVSLAREWLPFHEGLVRQLSLLFDDWPTSAPTAPLDGIEARLAPAVAMRRLREVAARLRYAVMHSTAGHTHERCWQDLCDLAMEAAGYDCATLDTLAAAALTLARHPSRREADTVEVAVPVVAGDGHTATMAHLTLHGVTRTGGVPATFEPAQAFEQAAQSAAADAVRAALAYLGERPGTRTVACQLCHPPGILVEGASLGPAVFAGSVLALCGVSGRVLGTSLALLGTLDLTSAPPSLGPVGSRAVLRAKYAAVPPDMLAVHSTHETLAAPEMDTGAVTEALGRLEDLWPRLGPGVTEVISRRRSRQRRPALTWARPAGVAVFCLLVLSLAWVVLGRPGRERGPTGQTMPGQTSPASPLAPYHPASKTGAPAGDTEPAPPGEAPRSSPPAPTDSTAQDTLVPAPGPMVPQEVAWRDTCRTQLKSLARALLMYATDYDQRLPLPQVWTPAIYPYIQRNYELLECPAAPGVWGYAMNSRLAGTSLWQLSQPAQTFLLFDSSRSGPSATLDTSWIAYRHMNGANVARADGSTRWYVPGQRPQ